MAFLKYANASVKKPGINHAEWDSIRRAALSPAPDFKNRESAKIVLQEYDPKKYLLTHCTIIASVDTEAAPTELGRHMVDGFQIDRRYPDYYITSQTSKYVNNNHDAWERKLLLSCFKTFIGAENYVEHIQIPELSKGKIIDAAARNIGDSIYTDKRHDPLVKAIVGGHLGTLSMGCSVDFTTCTRCGNTAEDETNLCPHVRYFKGSEFIDELGQRRKTAELCGHSKAEPGSVKFIEASWVANPAFTGAVLRNILSEKDLEFLDLKGQFRAAFAEGPRVADPNKLQVSARSNSFGSNGSLRVGQDQFEGLDSDATPKKEEDPLHKAVADLADVLKEKAIEHVRSEIGKSEADKTRSVLNENEENESIIKSAMRSPQWAELSRKVTAMTGKDAAPRIIRGLIHFKHGGWAAVKKAGFSGLDILAISRVIDRMTKRSSISGETRIYRAVVTVGGTAPYQDVDTYLAACRQVIGRGLTGSEAGVLLEKGRLYSL